MEPPSLPPEDPSMRSLSRASILALSLVAALAAAARSDGPACATPTDVARAAWDSWQQALKTAADVAQDPAMRVGAGEAVHRAKDAFASAFGACDWAAWDADKDAALLVSGLSLAGGR